MGFDIFFFGGGEGEERLIFMLYLNFYILWLLYIHIYIFWLKNNYSFQMSIIIGIYDIFWENSIQNKFNANSFILWLSGLKSYFRQDTFPTIFYSQQDIVTRHTIIGRKPWNEGDGKLIWCHAHASILRICILWKLINAKLSTRK